MGWFDGVSVVGGDSHRHQSRRHSSGSGTKKHHSSSHLIFGGGDSKKNHSSSHSVFGGGDSKKNHSSHSIFGIGEPKKHSSSHSVFSLGEQHDSSRSFFGGRSSSYYKRSPRKGYIHKIISQLRRLLRDLIYYMKKNPFKVFFLVIMPLITGGALTGLLRRFGLRLPVSVQRVVAKLSGGSGASIGATTIGRGRDGSLQFQREKYEGPLGEVGKAVGAMGGASGLMNVAKMFI